MCLNIPDQSLNPTVSLCMNTLKVAVVEDGVGVGGGGGWGGGRGGVGSWGGGDLVLTMPDVCVQK